MIQTVARITAGTVLILALAFGAFVLAVEHPSTSGPTRCWLQETFYTQEWADPPAGTPIVDAAVSTVPVRDLCDAADDPAIAVSGDDVWVIGTNKQRSLNVYGRDGALVHRADDLGAPNNADQRKFGGRILVFASDKDDAEIEAFELDPRTGELRHLPGAPFAARAEDEVYGLCLFATDGELYAFTTDKSGLIVQYLIDAAEGAGQFQAREVRQLRVATQPEGCVVDDRTATLFVGEEDIGIWRFDADADAKTDGELIASTGENGPLVADVEGLAIYPCAANPSGFLIASSQGDNSYAVFERSAPHAFLGKFQVRSEGAIVGDTDGLDVTSGAVGSEFPKGMLVVQDGFIRDADGNRRNQRFAYVSWSDVEAALGIAAICD